MTDTQSIVYVPDITQTPVGVPAQIDGAQLVFGRVAPGGATGVDGSYYIDAVACVLYGPRVAGLWPAGQSFRGQDGGALPLVAGAGIALHRSLMFGSDGRAILADPTAAPYVWAGLASAPAATGMPILAARAGLVTDPAWAWTPLTPLFAAPGGLLTHTAPSIGAYHKLGAAVTATTILLAPDPVITRT